MIPILVAWPAPAQACACCETLVSDRRTLLGQADDGAVLVRRDTNDCASLISSFEVWPLNATEPAECWSTTGVVDCETREGVPSVFLSEFSAQPMAALTAAHPHTPAAVEIKDLPVEPRAGRLGVQIQTIGWSTACHPASGSREPLAVGEPGVLVENTVWSCEAAWRRYEVHAIDGSGFVCVNTEGATTACATAWTSEEADFSETFPTPMGMYIAGATFTTWEGGGVQVIDRLGLFVVGPVSAD